MSEMEAAVRVIVDLLVRGQYTTVEKVTRARRLTAKEIKFAVDSYGRTLISPEGNWWSTVVVTPVDGGERPEYYLAVPLWTREEGRSDLTLELALKESVVDTYDAEVLDIRVL